MIAQRYVIPDTGVCSICDVKQILCVIYCLERVVCICHVSLSTILVNSFYTSNSVIT